jgi:hypothetical protein
MKTTFTNLRTKSKFTANDKEFIKFGATHNDKSFDLAVPSSAFNNEELKALFVSALADQSNTIELQVNNADELSSEGSIVEKNGKSYTNAPLLFVSMVIDHVAKLDELLEG